jgi:hypothetical protein
LFGCVDGLGKLDFWDLNKDVEVPLYRYDVGKNSLNKMSWSSDGKRIAVGDVTGKVSILNLDKEVLIIYVFNQFSYIILKLKIHLNLRKLFLRLRITKKDYKILINLFEIIFIKILILIF